MRTVVIGVGNPTLTDDGVGLQVAAELAARLDVRLDGPAARLDVRLDGPAARSGRSRDGSVSGTVEITGVCAGGLRLMEAMVGYDRAIVVDALATGDLPPGTVVELDEGDLCTTRNLASVHDLSLGCALDLGRAAGVDLPAEITVFGVRAEDVTTFGETLSPQVAAVVPVLVDHLVHLLAGAGAGVAVGAGPERTEQSEWMGRMAR